MANFFSVYIVLRDSWSQSQLTLFSSVQLTSEMLFLPRLCAPRYTSAEVPPESLWLNQV